MSSSLPQTATNSQSLNGIISLSDGVITIEDGIITGLDEIDLVDLQVSDTATIENLIVNNQIDMTLGQIKNVAAPTDNGDAVNKQYVDGNFLNRLTTTTQNVASKLIFNNATTDIVSNPVINMFNIIGGSSNGNFLRFQKGVVETPNLQIGGLSACDKNIGNTTIRVADLIFSRGSSGEARMDLKVINGNRNPLTITDGEFISRNDTQTFLKQDLTNLLNYTTASDKWTMYKPLDMNTTNKITSLAEPTLAQDASTKYYTDNHSNNGNYLLRNGTLPMTGNLQMGSYKITNLLDPFDLNDGANKFYCDTQSANTHYLLRNGTLAMTGNLNLATHDLTTTGDINCNDITAGGNINATADMSCADFNSGGNQTLGTNSFGILDVKSSAFFEASVLIETNKHLAFYNSDFTTDSGMKMYFDRSVGTLGTFFMDMRGSEIRVRTDPSAAPTSERVKINNNETTINNNLICNGNVTLGNFATGDTLTCNCQATFPTTSKLTFEGGSILSFDSGAEIHGFRLNLISVGANYTISSGADLTNDGILCTNMFPTNIIITMPVRAYVWNSRKLTIKTQTGDVKIRQATGTYSTTRNNNSADLDITTNYQCVTYLFDSDFGTNGKIWSID